MLLPWQHQLYQTFVVSALQQRFHHAQLLIGPIGVGKQHLAGQLAQALLCSKTQDFQPCGQCKSCSLFQAETHPDYFLVARQQGQLGIDQIRDISTFVHHAAQQGGNKVVVLQDAHKMTHAAANALLKTLEEPNEGCYLILTCVPQHQLPATIFSRCQQTQIQAGTCPEVSTWIKDQISGDYPWFEDFYDQPLRLLDWQTQGCLQAVDELYHFAYQLPERSIERIDVIIEVLKQTPDLANVFANFILKSLREKTHLDFLRLQTAQQAVLLWLRSQSTMGKIQEVTVRQLLYQLNSSLN